MSCTSTGHEPTWIYNTPQESSHTLYAVGGPSKTLTDARLMATQEMAGRLNQYVTALTTYSSVVSYDEINRLIQDDLQSWVQSGSLAVISGLGIQQRWQDPETLDWWVLAKISENEFVSSYEETIKLMAQKEAEKSQHLKIVKGMLLPYINRRKADLTTSAESDIKLLASTYSYLNDNIFSSPKIVEINGQQIELETFLEIQLQTIFDSISIKVPKNRYTVQTGASLPLNITVESTKYEDIGNLSWEFYLDGEYLGSSFETHGEVSEAIVLEKFISQPGMHTLSITLNGRSIGLNNPKWWNRIHMPKTEITIETIEPRVQYQLEVSSDYEFSQTDYLSAKVLSALSSRLDMDLVQEESSLGTLKVTLITYEGTKNTYGVIFLHGNLEVMLIDKNGKIIWKDELPKLSVNGIEFNRTVIDFSDKLTQQLQESTSFIKMLKRELTNNDWR